MRHILWVDRILSLKLLTMQQVEVEWTPRPTILLLGVVLKRIRLHLLEVAGEVDLRPFTLTLNIKRY
jgi:hypothetical protein